MSNNNNKHCLNAQYIANTKSKHFTLSLSCYPHNCFHKVGVFLLLFTERKQALEEMTYPMLYEVASG